MSRADQSGRRTFAVVNPTAGSGRADRIWPTIRQRLRERLGPDVREHVTSGPRQIAEAVRFAVAEGRRLIVAVGGDGTFQEAVNGMFADGVLRAPDLELGVVSCGTGGGLADSLRLPASPVAQLEGVFAGGARRIDVGRLRYRDAEGGAVERLWLNECQAGIGGAVVAAVDSRRKALGGTLAFGTAAVAELIRGRCYPMEIRFDDGREIHERLVGVVVGNGSRCGGGMALTPRARPDDGLLDTIVIRAAGPFALLRTFPGIYRGAHVASPVVGSYRCNRLTLASDAPVAVEADGELLGRLPAEVDLLCSVLPVRGASARRD